MYIYILHKPGSTYLAYCTPFYVFLLQGLQSLYSKVDCALLNCSIIICNMTVYLVFGYLSVWRQMCRYSVNIALTYRVILCSVSGPHAFYNQCTLCMLDILLLSYSNSQSRALGPLAFSIILIIIKKC